MNDKKKWQRRLAPHIYDYNYKVGESYYNPQTNYIENRDLLRSRETPPEAQSFAERYANRPIYGKTRGLPYDSHRSELSKPLASRRAQSVGRASSRDRDYDDYAPSSRQGRDRERKVSFNVDDFLQKLSVDDDLKFQEPIRRYPKSSKKIAGEEDFDINPKVKQELEEEFKRIKKEFKKADSLERGSVPRTTQFEETTYNSDLGVPGRRNVRHEEVNYTLPPTGTKVKKSTHVESSKYESTRPPRAPKPSRFTSIDDDLDFKMPTRSSRLRKFSISDMDDDDSFSSKYQLSKPSSSRQHRSVEEDKNFQQGLSLRERRRAEESEELSSHISSLVNKIKNHDGEGGYKFTRTIRASSLDPYEREPRARARTQARANQFTYGVSK